MSLSYIANPSESDLLLAGSECHLWQIPLSSGYANKLREKELIRYRRITHPDTREDYAASQAGLRAVLGRYVQCPAEDVLLHRRERGKPFLLTGPEFNLSHSAGLVLMAVSLRPVGLDVESAARSGRFPGLAAKFFSPAEQKRINFSPSPDRMFLRHWVCKEATVKLSGDGIFRGLRDAEVIFEPGGEASGRYRGRPVFLQEFQPSPDSLAALASWEPLRIGNRFQL